MFREKRAGHSGSITKRFSRTDTKICSALTGLNLQVNYHLFCLLNMLRHVLRAKKSILYL